MVEDGQQPAFPLITTESVGNVRKAKVKIYDILIRIEAGNFPRF